MDTIEVMDLPQKNLECNWLLDIFKLTNAKNDSISTNHEAFRIEKVLNSEEMMLVKSLIKEGGVNRIIIRPYNYNEGNIAIVNFKYMDIEKIKQNTMLSNPSTNDILINFNPEFILSLNNKDLGIVVEHEFWHIVTNNYYPKMSKSILEILSQINSRQKSVGYIFRATLHLYLRNMLLNKYNHKQYFDDEIRIHKTICDKDFKNIVSHIRKNKANFINLYIETLYEYAYIYKLLNNQIEFEKNRDWCREQVSSIIPNLLNKKKIFEMGDTCADKLFNMITHNGNLIDKDMRECLKLF